jgi:hypothetical protein
MILNRALNGIWLKLNLDLLPHDLKNALLKFKEILSDFLWLLYALCSVFYQKKNDY